MSKTNVLIYSRNINNYEGPGMVKISNIARLVASTKYTIRYFRKAFEKHRESLLEVLRREKIDIFVYIPDNDFASAVADLERIKAALRSNSTKIYTIILRKFNEVLVNINKNYPDRFNISFKELNNLMEDSESDDEPVQPPKRRGRPPKVSRSESENETPKRRGRPQKNSSDSSSESDDESIWSTEKIRARYINKNKRVIHESDDEAPKKRRGRPPKTSRSESEDEPIQPPKRRGRPPKVTRSESEGESVEPPKKRRGRPPKSNKRKRDSDDEYQDEEIEALPKPKTKKIKLLYSDDNDVVDLVTDDSDEENTDLDHDNAYYLEKIYENSDDVFYQCDSMFTQKIKKTFKSVRRERIF
jgi:hypothetical protein